MHLNVERNPRHAMAGPGQWVAAKHERMWRWHLPQPCPVTAVDGSAQLQIPICLSRAPSASLFNSAHPPVRRPTSWPNGFSASVSRGTAGRWLPLDTSQMPGSATSRHRRHALQEHGERVVCAPAVPHFRIQPQRTSEDMHFFVHCVLFYFFVYAFVVRRPRAPTEPKAPGEKTTKQLKGILWMLFFDAMRKGTLQ